MFRSSCSEKPSVAVAHGHGAAGHARQAGVAHAGAGVVGELDVERDRQLPRGDATLLARGEQEERRGGDRHRRDAGDDDGPRARGALERRARLRGEGLVAGPGVGGDEAEEPEPEGHVAAKRAGDDHEDGRDEHGDAQVAATRQVEGVEHLQGQQQLRERQARLDDAAHEVVEGVVEGREHAHGQEHLHRQVAVRAPPVAERHAGPGEGDRHRDGHVRVDGGVGQEGHDRVDVDGEPQPPAVLDLAPAGDAAGHEDRRFDDGARSGVASASASGILLPTGQ